MLSSKRCTRYVLQRTCKAKPAGENSSFVFVNVSVIGLLALYLYRYWHHASRLLLVIKGKKKEKIFNIPQITPDRKKNKIMAHLTHSVSGNNASVLSKIAYKNLPILSNFIQHVPLRINPVSSVNAASLKHDCNYFHAIPSQHFSLCQ